MLQPNSNIKSLVPAVHGGINYSELEKLGIKPEDVLDFSVSTNPFGPPPGMGEAIQRAVIDRYPDSEASEFRQLLAEKLGVAHDNLIIGSGSTELIRLVSAAYFGSADNIIVPTPTYGDYKLACGLANAHVLKQPMLEETGFRLDIAETIDLISRYRAKGIFLCNPNNPTARYLSAAEIEAILSAAPDCLVVLDEAYVAFTTGTWSSLELTSRDNLIVLRSMTKDYAIAGLRLGYAVASRPVISVLYRIKPAWNVSSVAQAAGVYALQAGNYIEDSRMKIREAKEFLVNGLTRLGFHPLPSQANFFLVKVNNAAGIRRALLRHGILVRDCTSFGLPHYIRLALCSMDDCRRLIAAIKKPEVLRYAV